MAEDVDFSTAMADMYRAARDSRITDFRAWALAHCRQWVHFHSASWVSGCIRDGRPLFHEVYTEGLESGYWNRFLTLVDMDPLGPRMFANPGQSFLTTQADFPPAMVTQWMQVFDVESAISGMAADITTGVYSAVCWHRDGAMPAFSEANRQLHQQFLPHWVECLNIHRLSAAFRELSSYTQNGHELALAEPNGQLHFAQTGIMPLLDAEFESASGGVLPDALMNALRSEPGQFQGTHISATRAVTPTGLWLIQVRAKSSVDLLTPREREICQLLSQGFTVKSVARHIRIAPSTVDNLKTLAYRKLGVQNRTGLARKMASTS